MARSCERRSFDAATILTAFVICCVFFTLRIRRRMSMRFAILVCASASTPPVPSPLGLLRLGIRGKEDLLCFDDRGGERGLDLLRELARVADLLEERLVLVYTSDAADEEDSVG